MHSFAELLLDENRDQLNEIGRKYLRQILASSTRLDHLIQDAFDYSLVAGAPIKLQPVDTAALLHGMMESYPQFQPPKAEIRLQGVLPVVLGNEALLTQCFSNLLNNAVKFTPPGTTPHVNVRTEIRSEVVRFWVEDQGIGIPKPAHDRIFGMFQRAHIGYEGTGIGLAIVRKAVERMGGRVGVESEPGHGSRFWVELRPAHAESDSPHEQQLVA
jgi:signal transduction histidine kinase